MATLTIQSRSGFVRYAWTVFVGLGALLVLLGVGDLIQNGTSLFREDSLNELLIGLFGVAIAVYGLRRGERWAWYAMLLWPVWLIAQSWRAFERTVVTGESNSTLSSLLDLAAGFVLLPLIVIALTLSYRASFSNRG
jgi:hypothetical protein